MSTDLSEFHQTFFEECFDSLDAMEEGLLSVGEGDPDDETINTIFRGAHSIKGGAGMFGFKEVAEFTHVLETLLDEVRDGKRKVTPDASELFLQSVDCLRQVLGAMQKGTVPDYSQVEALTGSLQCYLDKPVDSPEARPEYDEIHETRVAAGDQWHIEFRPHKELLRNGNEPSRLLEELGALGSIAARVDASAVPCIEALDPESCYLSWTVALEGEIARQEIEEVFDWVEGECDLVIANSRTISDAESEDKANSAVDESDKSIQPPRTSASTLPAAKSPSDSRSGDNSSLRVGIDKVDSLINLVGELVITQSMLNQCGKQLDLSAFEDLRNGLAQLERNTRELQESVLQIRMLPIKFSFRRFPRLVRDLSNKLGKKIELKLVGEQTELDKTVLEKIADPLVHVVRNALDHGIEMPEVRKAAGKDECGLLTLTAYHAGGNIVIEVSDDGAGLPVAKIRAKAIAQGLINEDTELSDEEAQNLIFRPGFSTAAQVSDLSGRGVGMDVVRRNIKDLGGSVDIRSVEGKGSTLTIRLPLTLAILDGQLVSVGNEIYIIPLVSIVESIQINPEFCNEIAKGGELYRFRDNYIPIIRLYQEFGIESRCNDLSTGLLVIVETDGSQIGLFVDDLLGQQQVVIKSLETNYEQVPGISGATILGDGTVALILDMPSLIESHLNRIDNAAKQAAA